LFEIALIHTTNKHIDYVVKNYNIYLVKNKRTKFRTADTGSLLLSYPAAVSATRLKYHPHQAAPNDKSFLIPLCRGRWRASQGTTSNKKPLQVLYHEAH